MTKTCSKCKTELNLDNFNKNKAGKYGRSHYCRECTHLQQFNYRIKNPEKVREREKIKRDKNPKSCLNSYLKYTFEITLDQYNQLVIDQNGNCAICKINQTELDKRLCVDHDHTTGKIRGLLCQKCNAGIGMLKDSIIILEEATKYLKKHDS